MATAPAAPADQEPPNLDDFDFSQAFAGLNNSPLRVDPQTEGGSGLQDGLFGGQMNGALGGLGQNGSQARDGTASQGLRGNSDAQHGPETTFSGSQIQALFSQFEDRLASRIEKKLSAVQDSVAGSSLDSKKRKADSIKNDGIRKQYVPLEESSLRMHEVNETLAAVAEGEAEPIDAEQAGHLREHLEQGIKFCTDRMQFLEIAETEGWPVARKVEEDSFLIKLPEDLQSQVKKARKAVKADELAKEKKKPFKKFRGSRGGFGGGFGGGFRRFSGRGGFNNGFSGFNQGFSQGFSHQGSHGPKGVCWSCGNPGHISAYCTAKSNSAVNSARQNV